MTRRPIGGFLSLRVPLVDKSPRSVLAAWAAPATDAWLLHNARSALHALWAARRPSRIWLPAYVCSEVVTAVPRTIEYHYYPVDEALSPRPDFLASHVREGDSVLAIDYFGRPPCADFVSLARERTGIDWIEDRAHALDTSAQPWAEWLLYSPRKLLGVPDGGVLVATRARLPSLALLAPTDFSFALPSLERFEDDEEADNERWYTHYRREEEAMSVGNQAMSRLSLAVLNAADIDDDVERRRRNYATLFERLGDWALFPEPRVSFAPMGFPVRVESAAALSARLAAERIFAARHWPTLPSDRAKFATEHRLAAELLTLPCDYRYNEADMHRVADAVIAALGKRQ